jgi:methyl-accepting chemotaxis protein
MAGADERGEGRIEPGAWPPVMPVVRRSLARSFVLGVGAAAVTLLCIDALTWSGVTGGDGTGWMLIAVMVTHLAGAMVSHVGFFRDLRALDRERTAPIPDRAVLERGFVRVVNAPRHWFGPSVGWFVLAAFDLSLLRHWTDPEVFPWANVLVWTTGSLAGALLLGTLLFFLHKREFAELRARLGAALGDAVAARRFVRPVSIRAKVLVGVGGALVVATAYGAVLAQVRAQRTAEASAVGLGSRMLAELGAGAEAGALEEVGRRLGIVERLVVSDASLTGLEGALRPIEIEAIREAPAAGDSSRLDSPHHFAWRTLPDGRVAVTVAPGALFEGRIPPLSGALGVFLGLVLLVTMAVAGLLVSDLERSVRRLGRDMARLASGDLRRGHPAFWEDEMGQLAAQVDDTADALGAMIVGVRRTADGVEAAAGGVAEASERLVETRRAQADGDRALRESILGVTGPMQGIGEAVGQLTASVEEGSSSILEMRSAGRQLDQNASVLLEKVDEVSSAVDELIRSVRDVLEQAESLSGAAVDTSSSMEEMAASLREVDANAVETARLSDEVVRRAEGGRETVRATVGGMERIRETTLAAQSVIRGLGGRTQEIGEIIDVIDDVAEETNLLALNAAIIAAQAGENGRAFSVVAEEIKSLADRVLSSTREIEQVIRSVQEEASNAVTAIEEGSRVVDEGVAQADQAGEALDEITSSARDSGTRIAEIVTAVNEQNKAAGHVVSLMERVRTGVDHIRRAGEEQDRGNESMLASTEVMREIARHVRGTTAEQAQGAGRIAEGVEAVSAAVERIHAFLSEQTGACQRAESEVGRSETRTRDHGELAEGLDAAVGTMRESADQLRDAVGRFRV